MRNSSSCCAPARNGISFLGREMDQLLTQVLPVLDSNCCTFLALANVTESDTSYEITLDLPGMTADDVKLEFQDGVLTVSGERKTEAESSDRKLHRIERRYGVFSRSFKMQEVDSENITAEYKNGVLTIVAPKIPAATPRKIDIKTS